jgi:sugar/nucleoside kinase (ribokinase family)
MADFAVIGYVVIDMILDTQGERVQLGGAPTYGVLVAKTLGKEVKMVTKIGGDIESELLSQLKELAGDLDQMMIKDATTTRFRIDLRGAERKSRGGALFCEEIKPDNVKDLPDAVILAPVMWEIPWTTLASIVAEVLAVDIQGFIRTHLRSGDASILLKRWIDTGMMKRVAIYKSTEDELRDFTCEPDTMKGLERIVRSGPGIAIATRGSEGAMMIAADGRYNIPAYQIQKMDDMGLGDAFTAGFFCEYLDGRDPSWCASMGAAMASCVGETIGPRIDASHSEIVERAEDVYNRIIRL